MATTVQMQEPRWPRQPGSGYPLDDNRGTWGIAVTIATEATLFVCLFASYFYLETNKNRWLVDKPPKLLLAFVMLAVLMSSSFVLHWGERQVKKQRYGRARLSLVITILMGMVFLTIQAFEYMDHWKELTPYSDSYGSIFYTITTFHAAHVIVGLLMLLYTLVLPRYSPALRSPYRPYHVAALYWHFVDIVWLFVVGLLYVMPNLRVYGF
ncbi:MAG TPA: cytochrome c oxidase subunit 3 [Acidobacteriaceae bacterium]|jgi:heme/copper-type cytochrome/quinol oxidase subunit 3|nr:cytochrome c oxidase subunit 3 [Acidobacteriaceae bacterium]